MEKVTAKEKYSYGIGAFGKDMVYAVVATYLMIFFTDEVGISSVFVGSLFFFSRFWDAVNDPVMGLIVDNTKTKWGKFRPWILIGTLINAVVLVFLFLNPANFLQGKMVYVYCSVAYILWGMTYTIMDIPYWSMVPSFTSNPEERDKIAVIPRIFATLGGASVNTFGLMLIGILGVASKSQGYFRLGIIISIIFVISTLVTVLNVKEKNVVENKDKIKISEIVTILGKNDQLLVIIASVVIFQVAQFLYSGFLVYFFTYANTVDKVKIEANWVVNQLAKYPKTFEFPIFFDQENDLVDKLGNPGKTALTNCMNTFCQIINDAGYMAGIYTNNAWATSYVNWNDVKFKDHMWVAQWSNNLTWTKSEVRLWQMSGSKKLEGYSGDLDYDQCFFDYPTYVRANHKNGF